MSGCCSVKGIKHTQSCFKAYNIHPYIHLFQQLSGSLQSVFTLLHKRIETARAQDILEGLKNQ